jgi:hypothetical protein
VPKVIGMDTRSTRFRPVKVVLQAEAHPARAGHCLVRYVPCSSVTGSRRPPTAQDAPSRSVRSPFHLSGRERLTRISSFRQGRIGWRTDLDWDK